MTSRQPLSVSGIFPHLAVWNHGDDPEVYQEPECGIGAVVPWAGKLWYMTYTSHALGESNDGLHTVDEHWNVEKRPESVGGTHAARFIHKESKQLFIGCYVIDEDAKVRVIDRQALPGRLTAVARHLRDPKNKVYYYSQECSLYEVDVHTLEVTLLDIKAVNGWHAKGAYTGQGVLVVSHNGEEIAPSAYWKADYDDPEKTMAEAEQYLKVPSDRGPEKMGVLAEWDGTTWREICRHQFNDVNSYGGLDADAPEDAPIFAQGWDKRSVLIKVRHEGEWTTWRLPKGSFTYDGWNGSYTEWPRFVDIGEEKLLMIMHGTAFWWPKNFSPTSPCGVEPIATHQRIIPDLCMWQGRLALAGQDTSRIGIPWTMPGHPHSNIQFTSLDEIKTWGPKRGYAALWLADEVQGGQCSDPLLIQGYQRFCLQMSSHRSVELTLEVLKMEDSSWVEMGQWSVKEDLRTEILSPSSLGGSWIRLRCESDAQLTVSVHLDSPRDTQHDDDGTFAAIKDRSVLTDTSVSLAPRREMLQVPIHNHNLQFLTDSEEGERYYEFDETLSAQRLNDVERMAEVKETAVVERHVWEDAASWYAISADGTRVRLPKSPHGGSQAEPCRDVREVVQERFLANLGGTFYEIPRLGVEKPYEQRNLPDYLRMRPIASHDKCISDYVVWRGLLVMSGVDPQKVSSSKAGHVFSTEDGEPLWFGAFDDLWKLGKPVGCGGPWLNTPVQVGVPSDPYLMTGFDVKDLEISHGSSREVAFDIEVDTTSTGVFTLFRRCVVQPGESWSYRFPEGFSAHWVRFVPHAVTVATAQLSYS